MFWLGPFEYKSKKELLDRLKDYLRSAPTGVITNMLACQKNAPANSNASGGEQKNWCRH